MPQSESVPFDRHESLGYQVNHLARTMARALSARTSPHGVVPGQFAQLLVLYERDGQTVMELAEAVAIEHSTMSRTLARMERDGLITTQRDAEDGRSRRIFLTDLARELEPTLKAEAAAVNDAFLDHLKPKERAELIRLIGSVIEHST